MQNLLILQERDVRHEGLQRHLQEAPDAIKAAQAAIVSLQRELTDAEAAIRLLEAKRNGLEGEVELAEEAIRKYKTQQLMVKKNEEYAALEHEIAAMQGRISALEDQQLELLDRIEQAGLALEARRIEVARAIELHELEIANKRTAYTDAQQRVLAAQEALDAAAAAVRTDVLQQYRYVRSQVKRMPVVVELADGRCQGCHLKVSGDINTETRRGQSLVRCDSCGRILYCAG